MKNLSIFAICFLAIAPFGCTKNRKDSPTVVPLVPLITILMPVAGTTYEHGDTVRMKAHIQHSSELHEYAVIMRNTDNNDTLFSYEVHKHATSVNVDTFWVNNVTVHSPMELTVAAEDHAGNSNSAKVLFHCHPM